MNRSEKKRRSAMLRCSRLMHSGKARFHKLRRLSHHRRTQFKWAGKISH